MRTSAASAPFSGEEEDYQDSILQGVSRTFALTIPLLPESLRRVVTNAYLLCRIADTIEDESALSGEQKQNFHARFRAVVSGESDAQGFARDLEPLLAVDALDAEKGLVANTATVVAVTYTFNADQRRALERCLDIMCRGMPAFERHASIAGLPDQRSLDQYCYYVAGVVGETLTSLFCNYSSAMAKHCQRMMRLGVSFGQGLQMVNILKDFWEDHERGVCWLPQTVFRSAGVELAEVSEQGYQPGFGEAYEHLIGVAHGHLRNGLEYALIIPRSEQGIRRFCLLALALAFQTLQCIHERPQFRSGNQVKVSHRVVGNALMMTRLFAGHDWPLRYWFERMSRGLPLCDVVLDDCTQVQSVT